MREFKDRENRTWRIVIDPYSAATLKDSLGVDLLSVLTTPLLVEFSEDPIRFVRCLAHLCRDQCDRAGVDERDFMEAMSGDAISDAVDAFSEELVDFFPRERRPLLQAALQKQREAQTRLTEGAMRLVNDPRMNQMIDRELAKIDQEFDRLLQTSSGS